MKKLLLVFTLCLVLLTGCDKKEEPMTFFPASFTQKEADLLSLLGKENDQYIYDFILDKDVKNMDIVVWKLDGKEWAEHHSMSRQFVDEKGRLSFEFDNISEGIRIALQSKNNSGHTNFEGEKKPYRMAVATSFLENTSTIEYGKEIPVAVQIATSKNMVTSYGVEYFHTPEEYAKLNYEEVYAVTVKFEK